MLPQFPGSIGENKAANFEQCACLQANTAIPFLQLLPSRRLYKAEVPGFHGGRRLFWQALH